MARMHVCYGMEMHVDPAGGCGQEGQNSKQRGGGAAKLD